MGATETPRQTACTLHTALCDGWGIPAVVPPAPGLLREEGEQAVGVFGPAVGLPVGYARFSGADVIVGGGGPNMLFGTPHFLAGYAVGSIVKRGRARKRARRLAQPQWRVRPTTGTVVTTRRLWCETEREWKWFNYDTIVDLQLDGDALVIRFVNDVPSVRLTGAWAPWIAVAIAHLAFGSPAAAQMPWLTRMYTMARALA